MTLENAIAFEKAVKVIDSCTTDGHVDAAKNYIMLFFKKTKDIVLFKDLLEKLNDKIEQINPK
jgi:hypothetical protein